MLRMLVSGEAPGRAAGPGALNPLALEIGGNRAAGELAVARLLDCQIRARDLRRRIEERDSLPVACARGPARDPRGHDGAAVGVEVREGLERPERVRREHVLVGLFQRAPDFDAS